MCAEIALLPNSHKACSFGGREAFVLKAVAESPLLLLEAVRGLSMLPLRW